MKSDFSGFEDLLAGVVAIQKNYETFIRKFLTEMGMRCMAQTKKLTPVDTGNLRNRWELSDVMRRGDELWIVLFNPAEYASFVEDGHRQDERFLPIIHLDNKPAKSKGKVLASNIRAKYGPNTKGMMLKAKWVPGYHMARISIAKIEREIPIRYEKAFKEFVSTLKI